MTNEKTKLIENSIELSNWILKNTKGLDFSKERRVIFSVSCYDLVIEHQLGIAILLKCKINGSAFALLRSVFEGFIRGAWLKHCATELQLDKYEQKDELQLFFGDMVKAVEESILFKGVNVFSALKGEAWTAMNSYTHSGFLQVLRRSNENSFEPTYTDDEIIEVLKMAGSFALLACQQIAIEANRLDLANEVYNKMAAGLESFC